MNHFGCAIILPSGRKNNFHKTKVQCPTNTKSKFRNDRLGISIISQVKVNGFPRHMELFNIPFLSLAPHKTSGMKLSDLEGDIGVCV